jgi:hypothetical protein
LLAHDDFLKESSNYRLHFKFFGRLSHERQKQVLADLFGLSFDCEVQKVQNELWIPEHALLGVRIDFIFSLLPDVIDLR